MIHIKLLTLLQDVVDAESFHRLTGPQFRQEMLIIKPGKP